MHLAVAKLEAWMRDYYHRVDYDIGSSGVRDLTVGELRAICGFDIAELESLILHDSESLGGERLRAALAERWVDGDVDRVMVTHGSSEAIYIVMHTVLEPGDEVIVVDPAYQQLFGIAAALDCRITPWPLVHDQRGFTADMSLLRDLATSGPRMIIVNFPHNPTGVSINRDQQSELIAIASEVDAWLVWDNAFGELTYASSPLPLPIKWYEKCICFGTLSKSYGLAGMRVGWCLASPEVLGKLALLRDYIALYVSPVLEFFAEQAVRSADRIIALQREHATRNLSMLANWAAGLTDLVRFTPPHGGVSAFVEFPNQPDMLKACRWLAEQHRVLLVPGACFGNSYRTYARLGFGGTSAELAKGLSLLELMLRDSAGVMVSNA